jgi:enterochelin esterase-like enzyme
MTPRYLAASVRLIALIVGFATVLAAQTYQPIPFRMDPRAQAAAKRLESVSLFDSVYRRSRRVWVYTPKGYDPRAATLYPLMVAFDGAEYRDTMPLPLILDTLQATGKAPAFVAILVDNSGGAERLADLANAAKMVEFLGRQLLPYVRARWHVTTDARRVIVTGSSAGGLASAFVAFQRPDLFANVLSQSGAFWRGAEASNGPPYEWLTVEVTRNPKRDIRFFVDVGEAEDHATIGGSGPNFRDANRRFRDALKAKGYSIDYAEIPNGQHAPAYWMTRLPVGIVALTSSWR